MAEDGDEFDISIEAQYRHARLNSNLPPPALLSVSEVQDDASKRSHNIFEYWNKLHGILNQYEPMLQRRWIKKNRKQRTKVLLAAWGPDIATTHRPDFQALRREPLQQRHSGSTRFRDHYLLPYINLEDLVKTNNLLNFLHSRGHNNPDTFAFFDRRTTVFARKSGAIQPIHLEGYVMLLRGPKRPEPERYATPENYGKLFEVPKATFMVVVLSGAGAKPGEGLLVLEIQEKILKFLLECVTIILHDLPLTAPISVSGSLSSTVFHNPS